MNLRTDFWLVVAVAWLAMASTTSAAETSAKPIVIDLSANVSVTKASISPGEYQFTLQNVLPNSQYAIRSEIVQAFVIPDPLSLPNAGGAEVPAPVGPPGGAETPCEKAKRETYESIKQATDEVQVGQLVRAFGRKLKDAPCPAGEIPELVSTLQKDTSFVVPMTFPVAAGEDLILTVDRKGTPGKNFGEFTFATAHLPGTWLALYGINYIHSGDEGYFAAANPDTSPSTYTITPLADRADNEFSPSIYFMWIKEQNYRNPIAKFLSWNNKDVFGGVTAGIGFDFDNPTAFLGYGVGWGYNVMLTAGVAMHKEKRLAGRYMPGDVVAENLTEDQLTEETYKPRGYVGISFRFGGNPFGKKPAAPANP